MTRSLEDAFRLASQLSEAAQDELAALIMAEIDAVQRFDKSLVASPEDLERLADEALEEHRSGKTQVLDSESS